MGSAQSSTVRLNPHLYTHFYFNAYTTALNRAQANNYSMTQQNMT